MQNSARVIVFPVQDDNSLHATLQNSHEARSVDEVMGKVLRFVLIAQPSAGTQKQRAEDEYAQRTDALSTAQIEAYRQVINSINQAIADSYQSFEAQTGLVGILKSARTMSANITAYTDKSQAQDVPANILETAAKNVRSSAVDVEKNLKAQIGNMGLSDTLRSTLRSSLQQLQKIRQDGAKQNVNAKTSNVVQFTPRAQTLPMPKDVLAKGMIADSKAAPASVFMSLFADRQQRTANVASTVQTGAQVIQLSATAASRNLPAATKGALGAASQAIVLPLPVKGEAGAKSAAGVTASVLTGTLARAEGQKTDGAKVTLQGQKAEASKIEGVKADRAKADAGTKGEAKVTTVTTKGDAPQTEGQKTAPTGTQKSAEVSTKAEAPVAKAETGTKIEAGKAEVGKAEVTSTKTEGAKAEGAKADGAKADAGTKGEAKATTATTKGDAPQTEGQKTAPVGTQKSAEVSTKAEAPVSKAETAVKADGVKVDTGTKAEAGVKADFAAARPEAVTKAETGTKAAPATPATSTITGVEAPRTEGQKSAPTTPAQKADVAARVDATVAPVTPTELTRMNVTTTSNVEAPRSVITAAASNVVALKASELGHASVFSTEALTASTVLRGTNVLQLPATPATPNTTPTTAPVAPAAPAVPTGTSSFAAQGGTPGTSNPITSFGPQTPVSAPVAPVVPTTIAAPPAPATPTAYVAPAAPTPPPAPVVNTAPPAPTTISAPPAPPSNPANPTVTTAPQAPAANNPPPATPPATPTPIQTPAADPTPIAQAAPPASAQPTVNANQPIVTPTPTPTPEPTPTPAPIAQAAPPVSAPPTPVAPTNPTPAQIDLPAVAQQQSQPASQQQQNANGTTGSDAGWDNSNRFTQNQRVEATPEQVKEIRANLDTITQQMSAIIAQDKNYLDNPIYQSLNEQMTEAHEALPVTEQFNACGNGGCPCGICSTPEQQAETQGYMAMQEQTVTNKGQQPALKHNHG